MNRDNRRALVTQRSEGGLFPSAKGHAPTGVARLVCHRASRVPGTAPEKPRVSGEPAGHEFRKERVARTARIGYGKVGTAIVLNAMDMKRLARGNSAGHIRIIVLIA